jgi:hypothetical protein
VYSEEIPGALTADTNAPLRARDAGYSGCGMFGPLVRKNSQNVQCSFNAAPRSTHGSKMRAGSELARWIARSHRANVQREGHFSAGLL